MEFDGPAGSGADEPAPTAVPGEARLIPGTVVAPDGLAVPAATGDDPVAQVEAFVERSRQEAKAACDALAAERDALRERLAKVEAALARWQALAEAIERSQVEPVADASAPRFEAAEPEGPKPEPVPEDLEAPPSPVLAPE